jgi:hypothetical protein
MDENEKLRPAPGMFSTWWARRSYFIEGGAIRPVRDSNIECYDPFEEHRRDVGEKNPRLLVTDLERLDLDDEQAIRDFAERWGLLGAVQHHTGAWVLASRPVEEPSPEDLEQSGQVWLARALRAEHLTLAPERAEAWLSPIPGSICFKRAIRLPDGPGGLPQEMLPNLWEHYQRFFPRVRGFVELLRGPGVAEPGIPVSPLPGLDARRAWDEYCEPLQDFRACVAQFAQAYHFCADWSPELEPNVWFVAMQHRFQDYLAGCQVYPAYVEGRWEWRFRFPSLLAAAYALLLCEFVENRYPRLCANERCKRAFIATRPNMIHCSSACRHRQKQRRYQSGKKEKAE